VRHAHRIYVLDKGEIVEDGSHDHLVGLNGLYARLQKHQDGRFAVV
jgi:ABC-type multidrug transport system fused ATPase/permease subunit